MGFFLAGACAAAVVVCSSISTPSVTVLEESSSSSTDTPIHDPVAPEQGQDDEEKIEEEEEEEEDPYANLPEEDEPTECSMCNTFRKGPCRPYWRKLERCFKDQEEEENGAQKCMPYFLPHQKCLMEFTSLYNLIRLTSLQEYIDETEETLPENQRRKMDDTPAIDWSTWDQFKKDVGPSFTQGIASVPKDTPLWKRFPENTEPVVLTLSTQIPREDKAGLLLRFAYVMDQDGMVLGVESNPIYRKLKDKAEGREEGGGDEEETEPGPDISLEFYVIPSMTRKIKLKAMYAMDPTTKGVEAGGKDDVLKESSFMEL